MRRVLITAWVGSFWAVGLLVAPILFVLLPDREMAGALARHLFAAVEYLGIVCGGLLLLLMRMAYGGWLAHFGARLVAIMLILMLVSLLVIDPWVDGLRLSRGVADTAFAWAHGAAAAVYLLLCLLGLWLLFVDDGRAGVRAE